MDLEALEAMGGPNAEVSDEGAWLVTEQIDAAAAEAQEEIERAKQAS